ncbi:thiaminase II/PqqC family protein [Saccharopolyspora gregorii]|uniref:transcriptional regulator n=1 Tax=Saccharopolyspora gregorii TaxID=33914 RepID=UPI0021AC0001|nr:transcriptional regulator [Saccharopolyspora gregorii]
MTGSARALLDSIHRELAPREGENRLVPLVRDGAAPRSVLAALAAEESRIVPCDWRSFLTLSARAADRPTREFFAGLAAGEGAALGALPKLSAALGWSEQDVADYRPKAGCQAYPAYMSWLALHAEPGDAAVAIVSNFAAFGAYCAEVAQALRSRYGLSDADCEFFDLFGTPVPGADEQAEAAVQAELDAGRITESRAREYARLFQDYELMFWNTLPDELGTAAPNE